MIPRAFTLWWLGLAIVTSLAAQTPALPPKEQFHLYLLIGQSNMAGRGKIEDQDKVPHPRVLMFTEGKTWAPAVDPLHFDKPIAGVGLGSSFGRAMAEKAPHVTIGLISCAVGGTPLSRWQKGGDLYQAALVRAKAALRDGTLKGILWHQGEADAGAESTARSYAEHLAQAVKDWRADLGVSNAPFVAGKLGPYLAEKSKDGKPSWWKLVNEQIDRLPTMVPYCAVADSAGLQHKGDQVHFDSPSLREFGRRYAQQMQALQAPKP